MICNIHKWAGAAKDTPCPNCILDDTNSWSHDRFTAMQILKLPNFYIEHIRHPEVSIKETDMDFWPGPPRITSKVCMKLDLGLNGNLFGGCIMSWIDEAAYLYAKKITNEKYLVTLRYGEMLFHKPVKEGDIVDFYIDEDQVKKGKTSISFPIFGMIERLMIFETDVTFVAVTSIGQKKPIDSFNCVK